VPITASWLSRPPCFLVAATRLPDVQRVKQRRASLIWQLT